MSYLDLPRLEGALCAGDIDQAGLWFPEGSEAMSNAIRATRPICFQCPVRQDCFEYIRRKERGLPAALRYGIWAGLTPKQRCAMDRHGFTSLRDA